MAVPKRKMSRSNTRHRRAQWKATSAQLAPITVDGSVYLVPQRPTWSGPTRPPDCGRPCPGSTPRPGSCPPYAAG